MRYIKMFPHFQIKQDFSMRMQITQEDYIEHQSSEVAYQH